MRWKTILLNTVSAIALACWPVPATVADYDVIILHPSGFGFTESRAENISGGQQVGEGWGSHKGNRALLWSGTAVSVIDLHPSGFISSSAWGVSGSQQVGYGNTGRTNHALLWSGTADSVIDLNPSGFDTSQAVDISGNKQAGWGRGDDTTGGNYHALLWSGTADSVIDLHPSGFGFNVSYAYGLSNDQQVGYAYNSGTGSPHHAFLWKSSSASAVDLHPDGFVSSEAYGVSGGQQVGWGQTDSSGWHHALLWEGTADSVIDLHPSGFSSSYAYDVSNGRQVGYGITTTGNVCALAWHETADSLVNMHPLLPTEYTKSRAFGIDLEGNIVGCATTRTNKVHAVLWKVPEPINSKPVADAGPDQTVFATEGEIAQVTLDGSGSSDPDGDELTYEWTWSIGADTYNATGINPTIELPVGEHIIQLIVNDGTIDSEPDYVEIIILPNLFGLVWMDGSSDFGYSLDEADLVYFYSFNFVQSYNTATGGWSIHMPTDWVYFDWPFYYELDPGILWFALPPESGLWVFHFSTGEWEQLPRIIP